MGAVKVQIVPQQQSRRFSLLQRSVLAWQALNKGERREIKKTEEEGGGRV